MGLQCIRSRSHTFSKIFPKYTIFVLIIFFSIFTTNTSIVWSWSRAENIRSFLNRVKFREFSIRVTFFQYNQLQTIQNFLNLHYLYFWFETQSIMFQSNYWNYQKLFSPLTSASFVAQFNKKKLGFSQSGFLLDGATTE